MPQRTWRGWIVGTVIVGVVILASLAGWFALERRRVQEIPILMYHHIGNADDSPWWVSMDYFERQIKFLRDQGYTSILPSDLAAHQRWGKPLPRRAVILTFDDGYLNTLANVEPILKYYGFRGMAYLITDRTADDPGQRRQFEGADCLTWPEVQAVHRRGIITFGGHSHTHQNLTALADPFTSVRECYEEIQRKGGFIPDSFCYPHGEYNDLAMEAVRHAGFTTGMACEDNVVKTGTALNRFALPRVSVMGGRHRVTVVRAREKESAGEVVFHVKHEGIPIEAAPCLRGVAGDGWLPARELGNGTEVEWRWRVKTPSDRDKPLSLELWDRNRIFLLYP